MVSFIADPRIKRADERRRAMLGQSLTPYKLPANPYGGSPVAGNLQRLAAALGGRWAGQEAASLKKAQLGAQNQILAQLSSIQAPGTAPTLRMSDTGMPMDDMAMQQPRQQQVSRTPYAMDSPSVSAEVLAQAGMQPGAYQLARQKAGAAGRAAYTERQVKELEEGLAEALRSPDPASRALARQYQTLLDPTAVALREAEERDLRKRKELSQRGAASYDISWALDRQTGKQVPVSDLTLKENPERYAPVPETTDLGPIPAWVGKTYNALDEQAALAQRGLSINANMNRLVTTGGLTTGAMQPFFTKIKGFMADLGFEVGPDLNAAQVLDAMSSGKALDVRNPKSGQGLPGATSDRDLTFLLKIVPGLAKTNFANEALLIIDTALTRRKLASVKLKMDYVSKNPHKGMIGYSSGEADKALQKIDLFTKDEKARLDALLKSPKVNTPVSGGVMKKVMTWQTPDSGD